MGTSVGAVGASVGVSVGLRKGATVGLCTTGRYEREPPIENATEFVKT